MSLQTIFLLISLVLFFTILEASGDEICWQSPCEYHFEVRQDQTMVYRPKDKPGKAYIVGLNGTRLQVIPSSFRPDDDIIGRFVDSEEVITADGVIRTIITINGQMPGPAIEVVEGAEVAVTVLNKLPTSTIVIHWHGLYQQNSVWMDGAAYTTQCPIIPHQVFTYRFIAEPAGTHLYHAHVGMQRIDGLVGALIIHRKKQPPQPPYFNMLLTDWWHVEGSTIEVTSPYQQGFSGSGHDLHLATTSRLYSFDGPELTSVHFTSGLINGKGRFQGNLIPLSTFRVSAGQLYGFRSINAAGEFFFKISIDQHLLRVVALDGALIVPYEVDDYILGPGETADFEIYTDQPVAQYWIRARTLEDPMMNNGTNQVLAILSYDGSNVDRDPTSRPRKCTRNNKCKTLGCPFLMYPAGMHRICVEISAMRSKEDVTTTFGLDDDDDYFELFLNHGFNYGSSINGKKFVHPSAPTYQSDWKKVPCESICSDKTQGCACTATYAIPYGRNIQLVLSNYQYGVPWVSHHPMHLHGHDFAVVKIGYGTYNETTGRFIGHNEDLVCENALCLRPRWNRGRVPYLNFDRPPVKNTLVVPARGYAVVRFRALNPGPWLYHCHSVNHFMEGMAALIEEGPDRYPPPPKGFPSCNSFNWSSKNFEEFRQLSIDRAKGVKLGRSYEEGAPVRGAGDSRITTNLETDPKPCKPDGHVALRTDYFIGLVIGCIILGVVLAVIVLSFQAKCSRKPIEGKSIVKPKSFPVSNPGGDNPSFIGDTAKL